MALRAEVLALLDRFETEQAVADYLGITQQAVSQALTRMKVGPEVAWAICRRLDLTPKDLIRRLRGREYPAAHLEAPEGGPSFLLSSGETVPPPTDSPAAPPARRDRPKPRAG